MELAPNIAHSSVIKKHHLMSAFKSLRTQPSFLWIFSMFIGFSLSFSSCSTQRNEATKLESPSTIGHSRPDIDPPIIEPPKEESIKFKDATILEEHRDIAEKSMTSDDYDLEKELLESAEVSEPMMTSASEKRPLAGTLTAGEINDLAKYDLWKHIDANQLSSYKSIWKSKDLERIAVLLTNKFDGALINAHVQLMSRSDDVLWSGYTNNVGRVELWLDRALSLTSADLKLKITHNESTYEVANPSLYAEEINLIKTPAFCQDINELDIAFVVDATSSMRDEIAFLKEELIDVIQRVRDSSKGAIIRTSSLFYRDETDAYMTKMQDFETDESTTMEFINDQQAEGGGDFPEAADSALSQAVRQMSWNKDAGARLLFFLLDAPSHSEDENINRINRAIHLAAKKGIRIIPIIASGSGSSNEYLMRKAAILTAGTYVFLTDHSGVGHGHSAPVTDAYELTFLNDLMVQIIGRYTKNYSCSQSNPVTTRKTNKQLNTIKLGDFIYSKKDRKTKTLTITKTKTLQTIEPSSDYTNTLDIPSEITHSVFPNPTSGQTTAKSNLDIQELSLLDASGQLIKKYVLHHKKQSLDLTQLPQGVYFLHFLHPNGEQHVQQLILKK